MAEERTLGLARTQEHSTPEPSKEELQRRMDQARDSISNTVTEIKETVANQVQAVKETLDWREQYKRRPVAWSLGAAGVGFLLGYGIAATVKGDGSDDEVLDFYASEGQLAGQPIVRSASSSTAASLEDNGNGHEGPSFLQKLTHTPAFGRVKDEVGNVGDAVLQELGKTVKQIIVPALMTSLKNFLGDHLPNTAKSGSSSATIKSKPDVSSGYQPTLDRGQS